MQIHITGHKRVSYSSTINGFITYTLYITKNDPGITSEVWSWVGVVVKNMLSWTNKK